MGIPVKGYEKYIVERNGKIYSSYSNRYLKTSITQNGYYTVELFDDTGKSKRFLVHRIVAETYLPNTNNYPQVNHIDENKSNNCVDNLEWCTAKYNMNYGVGAKNRHLHINYHTEKANEARRRNSAKTKKPVLQFSKEGVFVARFSSVTEASIVVGAHRTHISECCKGKRYKTVNGFIWKYDKSREER